MRMFMSSHERLKTRVPVTSTGATPAKPSPKVVVLQTVSTDYRQALWRALAALTGGDVLILAGARYFDPTIATRHEVGSPLMKVHNRYLFGRRLLAQRVPLRLLLSAETVIAELNPRILTTWGVVAARRVLGRRTVLWGHACSRHGPLSTADQVRQVMRHLAHTVVVYTDREQAALARRMPTKDVVVAPNGLLPRADMMPRAPSDSVRDFIYVGRLVAQKRPDLLVEAYLRARDRLPATARLLIVGSGPLRESLEQVVIAAGATERVRFFGHVSQLTELRAVYATALASVSPGYVGLSITQSLAFGVPMIIADREPHSPEIEAAEPNFNCVLFAAGSSASLADAIVALHRDAGRWLQRAPAISEAARARYAAETTAERLLAACTPRTRRAGVSTTPTCFSGSSCAC
jgi:glycosyltransferase involved in cell wall biosynthesis